MVSPEEPATSARLLRAYTITRGRTHAAVELPMEATLRVLPHDADLALSLSSSQVLHICDRRSVAEVSALVALPIGVVRVLLGDLVEQGYVGVQATLNDSSSHDERLDLIERTLRGLRAF